MSTCLGLCNKLLQNLNEQLLPPANEVCEGYVFTRECPLGGGWWYPSMPCKWYPSIPCRSPGLGVVSHHALQVSRPTPRGEREESVWGGVSRPTPMGGRLWVLTRGVSRPTPGRGVYPSTQCTEADPPPS